MPTKRTLTRQRDDALAQVRRLVDARDDALKDADTGEFNTRRLAGQVADLREENEQLHRQLKARPAAPDTAAWTRERSELRRALHLSERARARLDEHVRMLGQVNEQQAAELYDRAQGVTPR